MTANPLRTATAAHSHSVRLVLTLFDLGIVSRGKFNWINVGHDDECPALSSGSERDCRCDPEVEIGGRRYLFSAFCSTKRQGAQ